MKASRIHKVLPVHVGLTFPRGVAPIDGHVYAATRWRHPSPLRDLRPTKDLYLGILPLADDRLGAGTANVCGHVLRGTLAAMYEKG